MMVSILAENVAEACIHGCEEESIERTTIFHSVEVRIVLCIQTSTIE